MKDFDKWFLVSFFKFKISRETQMLHLQVTAKKAVCMYSSFILHETNTVGVFFYEHEANGKS